MIDVQRWLGGLETVDDQATEQMHGEIDGVAMARMLNLADVLELVVDGLNDRSFANQQSVGDIEQSIRHILADLRDELEKAISFREIATKEIRTAFHVSCDVILLSESEETELHFVGEGHALEMGPNSYTIVL